MSMWLSKKRKGDLVTLCEQLSLKADGLKKPELETLLSTHLYENQDTLWNDPIVASYYETLSARTPHKLRGSPKLINPVDPIIPEGTTRARRKTSRYLPGESSVEPEPISTSTGTSVLINGIPEDKDEDEDEGEDKVLTNHEDNDSRSRRHTASSTPHPSTPAPIRRSARISNILSPSTQLLPPLLDSPIQQISTPLPPSTEAVVTLSERVIEAFRTPASYLNNHLAPTIRTHIQSTQQTLSNVISVAVLVHLFEFVFLIRTLIPTSYPVTIPALNAGADRIITTEPVTFTLPDLFRVLEGRRFWIPVLTWAVVSVVLPGLVGYFVNLTKGPMSRMRSGGAYVCDPLTFALAKGILGWIVWYRGWVQSESLKTVENAVGKEVLVLVNSAVVGLVALWEGLVAR